MPSETVPSMATLETISEAIKLIDTKKGNLKKAFDELQSQSSILSSFSLSWCDLDSHFTSVQNELTRRFKLLESLASSRGLGESARHLGLFGCSNQSLSSIPSGLSPSTDQLSAARVGSAVTLPPTQFVSTAPSTSTSVGGNLVDSEVAQPELRHFCERMDWKGLMKYINDHPKEREAIRVELPAAFRCAPEPGAMVLDALDGTREAALVSKGNKDADPYGLRKSCLLLLEGLIGIDASSSFEVRERAKRVAFEWKNNVILDGQKPQPALGFLHLVGAYGLRSEFDVKELVDYLVVVARCPQATMLCRAMDLGDMIHDIIQKLLDTGKNIPAVKFIFEFGLSEKFPPVPILKAHLDEAKQIAKQVCEGGKNSLQSLNEAKAKESSALKAVIRVIEEQKLQAEYPPESLRKRVEQLEKKADKKRTATAPGAMSKHKQAKQKARKQHLGGIKHLRAAAPVAPAAPTIGVVAAGSSVQPYQQSHLQPPGLLPERSAAYISSASGLYGRAGSAAVVAPYTGSSAGFYGLAVTPQVFPEISNPPGYYDGSSNFSGYVLPSQHHQSYYPR